MHAARDMLMDCAFLGSVDFSGKLICSYNARRQFGKLKGDAFCASRKKVHRRCSLGSNKPNASARMVLLKFASETRDAHPEPLQATARRPE